MVQCLNVSSLWKTHLRATKRHLPYGITFGLVAWRSGNAFHPINEVTLRRAGLVL